MDNLFESFLKARLHLINANQQWKKIKIVKENGLHLLEIPNLELLAGLFGYVKYKLANKNVNVLCRGEHEFHKTTIPKLFRAESITNDEIIKRKELIDEICLKLPSWYKATRFKKEDVGPLLQHYGISTYWLDLVDNIFTASWFAFFNNKNKFGYIKFFINKNNNDKLIIRDLRKNHSSLSLRLHCQHGISAKKYDQSLLIEKIDFSDFMLGIVRIPLKVKNTINISISYMFPNKELDNTLKYFKKRKFRKNIRKILDNYGYPFNFIGEIK